MVKYDKVGGGSYDIYQERPEPEPNNGCAIVFVIALLVFLVASCAG